MLGNIVLYALMPIKPLEFKLKRDDATLSLHGSGAAIASPHEEVSLGKTLSPKFLLMVGQHLAC